MMRRWGSSFGGKEDKSDNDDFFNFYDDEEETINESTNQRTHDTSVDEVTGTIHDTFTLSDDEDATMTESSYETIKDTALNKAFDSTYESETKPPISSNKGKKTKSNKRKSNQAGEAGGKRKKTPSCCRGCSGFQTANCNLCAPCRDRPAMGGPNKLRRKCLQRACTASP